MNEDEKTEFIKTQTEAAHKLGILFNLRQSLDGKLFKLSMVDAVSGRLIDGKEATSAKEAFYNGCLALNDYLNEKKPANDQRPS